MKMTSFALVAFLAVPAFAQTVDTGSAPAALVVAPADQVVQAPVAVPPTWVQDVLVGAEKLPTIGPVVAKGLEYGSLLITILTALCGFLIVAFRGLSGIAKFAKLGPLADKISAFENGRFMYYLKYLSAFNAPKVIASASPAAADVPKKV